MHTRHWFITLIGLSVIILLGFGSALYAQDSDTLPSAPTSTPVHQVVKLASDAWVDYFTASNNYGNDTLLRVGSEECPGMEFPTRGRTYMRFVLSTIPSGQTIVKAELKLYQIYSTGATLNPTSIHKVLESWW